MTSVDNGSTSRRAMPQAAAPATASTTRGSTNRLQIEATMGLPVWQTLLSAPSDKPVLGHGCLRDKAGWDAPGARLTRGPPSPPRMPVATATAPPAASTPAQEEPQPSGPTLAWMDLAFASVACLAAAAAAMWMSPSPSRAILAFGVLAIAPGYLLRHAVLVPARRRAGRVGHCADALGVSPAYLGLVALAATFSPYGFRPKAIVAATLVASLALAAAAL